MMWDKRKIIDFANVITGGTPSTKNKSYWDGGTIPWLNSGELNQDIILKSDNFITEEGLKNSATKMMPPDTVLIALTGATTGVVGYLTFPACANQSVTGILPSASHHPKYLYYYLKSIRQKVLDLSYGGAQYHISQGFVQKIEVPLPPLHEQQRIAKILDHADAIWQKNREILKKYNQLAQSVFVQLFGDPAKNQNVFPLGSIRDLVSEVKYGTSAKASDSGQYPYLRMNNLTYGGEIDLTDLKYIDLTSAEEKKYLVEYGDILFNRTNSKELVGKTAVFKEIQKMAIAGYLIKVKTNKKANPDYISGYLNSNHGKLTLRSMCKSIIGMANINAQEFQDIKILIPPLALQERYSEIIDRINIQKKNEVESLLKSKKLFQCLMQKAFKGEL